MNFKDYQQAVAHRFKSEFSTVDALMVAVSGILIELDEVGRATTTANEHEELGDVLFYIAYSAALVGREISRPVYKQELVSEDDVYSNTLRALGFIHKCKRGTRLIDDETIAWVYLAANTAYKWVEQQCVDMESLYQANIKKVSSL